MNLNLPITKRHRRFSVFVTGSLHGRGRHRFESVSGVSQFLRYRAVRWINEYLAGGHGRTLFHLQGISMTEAGFMKNEDGQTVVMRKVKL